MGKGKRHAAEYRVLVGMLKDVRQAAGLSQAQLAKRLNKPQSYVSKVERAERLIDPVELRWWCRELDLDLTETIEEWERRLGR